MRDLNETASEYRPEAATALENDLMLGWYPARVSERCGKVGSLLELGIGHGYTAERFGSSCSRHVIVEGSSVVLEQFRRAHPTFRGELVFELFESYTPREQFDVVVMGFVLEHVDDPDHLLTRYRSFIRPGGKLYVAVPNAKSLNRRLGLELGVIDDIYSLNANDVALGHQRQYCRDTLRDALRRCGYRISHEEGIYLKPLPLSFLRNLPDFQANLQAMLRVGIDFPELCVALLVEATPE